VLSDNNTQSYKKIQHHFQIIIIAGNKSQIMAMLKNVQHTSLTHSWSSALLEKLPVVQLLRKFPAIYGT
jgi:hypothetical protein